MSGRRVLPILFVLSAAAVSCTLPGLASPTPFTFPTPNLTLTVIFAPSETPIPEVPTLPPPVFSDTPVAEPSAPGPSATPFVATAPSGQTRPNGSPAYAPQRGTSPTIDGDLSEWTTISYTLDACTFGCSLWSGTSDASGTYWFGWDAANLYLAVRVRDDAHVTVARGSRMYRGDIVELQFDGNLDADFTQTTLSLDDTQIGLSPGNFGSLTPEAYRWYPQSLARSLATVHVASAATSEGYALEASVPWSVLGATPAAGGRFGFTISLSDDDAAGTTIQQSLVSSARTRKLLDPTTWGTLILQ